MIKNAGSGRLEKPGNKNQMSLKTLWIQGFITSASNPKAVVFFAALFPQFIQSHSLFWPQFLTLSITYLVIDGLFLCMYGLMSSSIASSFGAPSKAWIERIGGSFLIGAAVPLGLKTVRDVT